MSDAPETAPSPAVVTPVTVTWKPAGPLVIEGTIRVFNNAGDELIPPPTKVPGQVKLCGCGHSLTKPFCDGSHKR